MGPCRIVGDSKNCIAQICTAVGAFLVLFGILLSISFFVVASNPDSSTPMGLLVFRGLIPFVCDFPAVHLLGANSFRVPYCGCASSCAIWTCTRAISSRGCAAHGVRCLRYLSVMIQTYAERSLRWYQAWVERCLVSACKITNASETWGPSDLLV
ncbi:hypothetical protein BV22DRAFT_459549 [Leucogyrophana mollusca]|uniref:Uncharacterized protein n=1 Tax=Leucogyrophana mollusca TaxID=85980 RepID=A0ACB8BIV8_9AGAM|nr:hypothetical protein BV22DRAFT_459549 [Leucogyrophana mollusca]